MAHFFPLRPYEIVFFEFFIDHGALLLVAVEDFGFLGVFLLVFFFFWWQASIELPPPATGLEKLEKEGLVVSPTNEAFVVGEIFPFEVQFDIVALIQRQK